jgi:hypothetical protein
MGQIFRKKLEVRLEKIPKSKCSRAEFQVRDHMTSKMLFLSMEANNSQNMDSDQEFN